MTDLRHTNGMVLTYEYLHQPTELAELPKPPHSHQKNITFGADQWAVVYFSRPKTLARGKLTSNNSTQTKQ